MPAEWIRVRNTDTGEILPHSVPTVFLEKFSNLKEVPSSRKKADRVRPEEPVQPGDAAPVVTEPEAKPGPDTTTITEPARPGKK